MQTLWCGRTIQVGLILHTPCSKIVYSTLYFHTRIRKINAYEVIVWVCQCKKRNGAEAFVVLIEWARFCRLHNWNVLSVQCTYKIKIRNCILEAIFTNKYKTWEPSKDFWESNLSCCKLQRNIWVWNLKCVL